ncbi:MAG TPA: glycosyltransferase family 4 protein, partial [Jiangellaceae bacterium]|nr:glycosyltransferase family 4 protein [Jiangellaceae bacterium]
MNQLRDTTVTTVHVVLPNDIDDPANLSGGNVYDRQLCRGLAAAGWPVREHPVRGGWPRPTAADRAALARTLAALPAGALVLVDGLVASVVPDVLVPEAGRLRLVVLMHMPLGDAAERAALSAAAAVVTTSDWSRRLLVDRYGLPIARVHTAAPGVDAASLTTGEDAGSRLLCVAHVQPHKGHDVLIEALATLADLPWSCVCVGSLDRDRGFSDSVRRRAGHRVRFVGPRARADLETDYAGADLLIHPSRREAYGMVVSEALARGIPVVATAVGGIPEALGRAPDGSLPGIAVPPDDPAALAAALRRWLSEPAARTRLRESARMRRTTLPGWESTAKIVSDALSTVA